MTWMAESRLKLWGPVVHCNNHVLEERDNPAQVCFFILRLKGRRNWFTGTKKVDKQSEWNVGEKWISLQIWVPTESPRARELCRERALRGFLPAPPSNDVFVMEFCFCGGFPVCHFKLADCLQTLGQFSSQMAYCCWETFILLMVCFTVICIHQQSSVLCLPSVALRSAASPYLISVLSL